MKKFLTSVGVALALLGSTLSPTRAQSSFFAPVIQSYEVQSQAGTFTDISGMSGTVLLNSLGNNVSLRGQVLGATAPGGTSPKATAITTAGSSATVNCFPIGFDFQFLGKTMKYFAVNVAGGVFFSETDTRAVPCPFNPTGNASTDWVLTIPYAKDTAHTCTKETGIFTKKCTEHAFTGTLKTSSTACSQFISTPASKAPACYRIDGTAGDRVLTVQHNYCITRPKTSESDLGTDEWIYQFKFYERDGSFEMVVKELQQNHNTSTATSMSDYKLSIGVAESNATITDDVFGSKFLNIQPNSGSTHKMSVGDASYNVNNNWQNIKETSYGSSTCLFLTPDNHPETGRTIRWNSRCATQQHPAVGEDAFLVNVNYPDATSAKVQVQYDMTKFASLTELYQAGTIVGVLSDSKEPDFTLQNGTLYLKDHTFPAQNGKAAPTVVFNQMYSLSTASADAEYPCGYKNSTSANTTYATYILETTVNDLVKGYKRYLHLYRMSYVCGTPLYSPLCHTIEIANKFRSVAPDLLETVGMPTIHTIGLKVKPHDGDDVLVVKTHDLNKVKSIPDEGPLAAGTVITEDLVVIGTYSEETTFEVTGLPDNDICYFVAIPVNKTTHEYDNAHTLNRRARVAHNGVPFNLDFRQEANGNPYKWIDKTTQKEEYYKDIYRPLPVGWTRTDNLPADRRDLGLGLGIPNFGRTAVAIYGQLEVQGTDADAISTPIYLNAEKIGVTYYMKFQARGSSDDGDVSETTPKTDDKFIIEYSIGTGNNWSDWTQIASYQGNALPAKTTWDGAEYYPIAARLTAPNGSTGKYLRFRFRMQTGSGHAAFPQCDYGCIYIMDVYESPECLTPTNIQQNYDNTTGTAMPVSWSDPNPNANKATAFELSYRKAYTGENWQSLTVNTTNTTLTGLTPSTHYAFKVTAVCPSDKSVATDSAIIKTLYGYAYKETMIEDSGYFYSVSGSNVYVRGRGPLERDITSYTGTLPKSGNASLTAAEDPMSGDEVWATKWGWEKWLLNRRCPQSMGVSQSAQNAWLITPVIENTTPRHAQVIRFRASAGWNSSESSSAANWTLGSVNPSVYGNCTLQVLLSNNGSFTKQDVVGTLNISSYTDLTDTELEIKVPYSKAKTGRVQVALFFQNPDRQIMENKGTSVTEISDFMFFEIQDLEYKNDTCPEFEAGAELTSSDITTQGAKLTWPLLNVASYVLSCKPADGSAEAVTYDLLPEDIQTDEASNCTYTLTGLNANTAYKVTVVGYCDEEKSMGTNELENTFTTMEVCNTPTAFKVQDITYYGATFSSVNNQSILLKRQVYVVSEDSTYSHLFEQTGNSLVVTEDLLDNMTYTAQTRSICTKDSSAWTKPITFQTPVDPANILDTFAITLNVRPQGAGTVTGAGRYEENTEITMTATANPGYVFKGWVRLNGDTVSRNATRKMIVKTHDSTFTAVFREVYDIQLNTQPTGTTGGTVTGAGTYEQGSRVTLTATPRSNYLFVGWVKAPGDTLSKNATHTFVPTASATYTAVFRTRKQFALTLQAEPEDGGSLTSEGDDEGTILEGRTIKVTATANEHFNFVAWLNTADDTLSKKAEYEFTATKNTTLRAIFTPRIYKVTLEVQPEEDYGTVKGAGNYNGGTTRRIVATPRAGYTFLYWKDLAGTTLTTDTAYTFTLTRDMFFTAHFKEKDSLNVTLNVTPANAGTVKGAGKYKRGQDAVLTATPGANYIFVGWVNKAQDTIEDNPYTFQPLRDWTYTAVFRTKKQFDITVVTLPNDAAGTVTGLAANGKAREGAEVTLTATPSTGYRFVEWQDAANNRLTTNASYTFTAMANVTYKAVFEEIPTPQYKVTLVREPVAGGTVSGAGDYDEGTVRTIKARPNSGYTFEGWFDGTTKLTADTVYQFTLRSNVTYTAKFKEKEIVDVAVVVRLGAEVNNEVGSVTGAGQYEKGKSVTLTATPASDEYVFSGWRDLDNDDELIGSANPFTFTATANVNYAAVFRELFEVTLNILPDDNAGTVTGAGPARQGFERTITAEAAEGYTFVGWLDESGNTVSSAASYTFTVQGNVTYTAKFETESEDEHTIRVVKLPNDAAGTVKGNGRYATGEEATLTATPAENYLFVAWLNAAGDTLSKSATYKFTVEGDATYTAAFRARARYTIEVEIAPNDEAGTVEGAGQHREGRTVELTATPAEGYTFVAWVNPANAAPRDTVSRNETYTFTATKNATYRAVFRRTGVNYTVTLNVTPTNAGTVRGSGSYRANQTVTLTATPKAGYKFVGWRLDDGTIASTEPSYQFQITRNITFTAVFEQKEVLTVTLNVTPENAGTVTGAGEYVRGAEATVTAAPARGYRFVEWQDEDGETLSTEAAYAFTVTTDVVYTALFEESDKEMYAVTLEVLPSGSEAGTVTGAGFYEEGTMATVTATAKNGYVFVAWLNNAGDTLSKEPAYTFEVVADITCRALFAPTATTTETVTIALKALPSGEAGTLKGAGKYNKGQQVTIEAKAAANYTFVAWINATGDTVSKNPTYTFKAETDETYSALFREKTANEQSLKAAFNVAAGNGHLYIDNLNAITVREVAVFNTVGRQLARFTPNSNTNLALPVDARYTVLVVRVVSEQGLATYKVYLH